jgi:signal transduction histidine kinase
MESAGESTRTSGTLTDLSCPSETGVLRSSLSRGTILAVAVVGASVVVFGVPEPIHLNALGARAGIETVVSSWASLSAGLLVVRFRDTRQRDDLWLLTALTSVALTDFVFSALPALIGSDLLGFGSGVQIGCNALVAVAFATAAFIPSGTVAGNGLRSGGVAALGVVAGVAVVALASLIDIVTGHPATGGAVPTTGLAAATQHPGLLAVEIFSSSILLISGIAFFCRSESGSHVLSGAVFLLAAARLQYLALPAMAPNWVTARDGLRLGAYALLLAAAVGRYAATQRRAATAVLAAERERIARHLHDGVAQDLAFIALEGQRLASELGSDHPLTTAARRALGASRGVIDDLSASTASCTDTALRQVADEIVARFGAEVNMKVATDAARPPRAELEPSRREQVVRIAREAIVNAIRHGHASQVDIVLDCTGPEFRLRVTDDGRGITETGLQKRTGHGLAMMHARAASVGGRLHVRRRTQGGTAVEVVLPYEQEHHTHPRRRLTWPWRLVGRRPREQAHSIADSLLASTRCDLAITGDTVTDGERRGVTRAHGIPRRQ